MPNASVARSHAEWLSLLDVNGPFLSMPVLMRAFPQGLDEVETPQVQRLRLAYGVWEEAQQRARPDPAIHTAWVRFVLRDLLGLVPDVRVEGNAVPPALQAPGEHGETLRPDLATLDPVNDGGEGRRARLLVHIYPREQKLDGAIEKRHWKASPATRMMELLHGTGVRLGLVTNGEHWLLVDATRGETTGFISWYASLWLEERRTLQAFVTFLGAHRFFGVDDADTLEGLLAQSASEQAEVTTQLGAQVREAVSVLVQAIDRADQESGRVLLQGVAPARLYEAALTVMMRLVFLMSAEERGLLLLDDPVYAEHYAVSTLRGQLREAADNHGEEVLERRRDAWCRLLATFRAVHGGIEHEDLRLPPYGGHLFDPDAFPFLEGRAIGTSWRDVPARPLPIHNRTALHLLDSLQMLQMKVPGGGAETRRLSFRALDVEQIGHVYETLLDHTAQRAIEPLLTLAAAKGERKALPLKQIEEAGAKGDAELMKLLREKTERSEAALRNAMREGRTAVRIGVFEGDRTQLSTDVGWQPSGPVTPGGNPAGPWTRGSRASPSPDRRPTHLVTDERLLVACNGDPELRDRIRPFAGLLAHDSFGDPIFVAPGSFYVAEGADRRTTGTHYTPRTLTEPIVQYTLEPLIYHGPAEGLPRDQWRLHSAADILGLKVCDMAMGSGAFLVQTCRYLAERLTEAWAETEETLKKTRRRVPHITPYGEPSEGAADETLLPDDPDERLALARRLVAGRCLYGVDKNRLAVEMAKLSLWLVTLAKGRPFTFVDHALRCGDSLLGIASMQQLVRFHPKATNGSARGDRTINTYTAVIAPAVEMARELRERLEAFTVTSAADVAVKERLLREAEGGLAAVGLVGDLVTGAAVATAGRPAKVLDGRLKDLSKLVDDALGARLPEAERRKRLGGLASEATAMVDAGLPGGLDRRKPFHWPLEFPEVFTNSRAGFDAIVGNPPFLGGQKITGALGTPYRDYLVDQLAGGTRGSADLCAYFFLRAAGLLHVGGDFGMLATNTIAQGETRIVGLDRLITEANSIIRAVPSQKWPGTANLEVACLWLRRGPYQGEVLLAHQIVPSITPYLTPPGKIAGNPFRLEEKVARAFQGSIVLGMGFIMSPEQAATLIRHDPHNSDVLFPYLNGEDLNSRWDVSPSRWVIQFDERTQDEARTFPDLWSIVSGKVWPERKEKDAREYPRMVHEWWKFWNNRRELAIAIKPLRRVLVRSLVSELHMMAFVPKGMVYAHKLAVFAFDDDYHFATLQSNVHETWLRKYSSTLRTDVNYSPSDCFDTFPFPRPSEQVRQADDAAGNAYDGLRQSVLAARKLGLTKTYNLFHYPGCQNADVERLRDLHVAMDLAVLAAYGWGDLALGHDFHDTPRGSRFTISPEARRELLDRLLLLNHQRHEEETRAAASPTPKRVPLLS